MVLQLLTERVNATEHGANDSLGRASCFPRTKPSCLSPRIFTDLDQLQDFTGEHLTTLIKKLVDIDSAWIPTDPGTSLCALLLSSPIESPG